jgi:hypothetical protein
MDNYKAALRKFTYDELIDLISLPDTVVEKIEAELYGARHSAEVNGPDAYMPDGSHVEIKTQKYTGKFQLRGRGKFGAISDNILRAKRAANETVIIVGYCAITKEVYYRFEFKFSAIAAWYEDAVEKSYDKSWSNYDTIPYHYAHSKTFKVLHVASPEMLTENKHKFVPGFYDRLMEYSKKFG